MNVCSCILIKGDHLRAQMGNKIKDEISNKSVIDKLSRTFSILGDATRIKIFFALSRKEFCVKELAVLLELTHSAISHQLRVLKDLDLVKYRKDGRKVYYLLNDKHIETLFEEGLNHVLEKI